MATLDARSDLQTLLQDNIDMSNVAEKDAQGNDLTRPKILIDGNDASDSGGDYTTGTIDLEEERYNFDKQANVYRRNRFVILATFERHDQSDDTTFRQILAEIDRILGVESFDITASHSYFSVDYTGLFRDRGSIETDLVFTVEDELQDVTV